MWVLARKTPLPTLVPRAAIINNMLPISVTIERAHQRELKEASLPSDRMSANLWMQYSELYFEKRFGAGH